MGGDLGPRETVGGALNTVLRRVGRSRVRQPFLIVMNPSSASRARAARTVGRLTLRRRASSCSPGSSSPQAPCRIDSRRASAAWSETRARGNSESAEALGFTIRERVTFFDSLSNL